MVIKNPLKSKKKLNKYEEEVLRNFQDTGEDTKPERDLKKWVGPILISVVLISIIVPPIFNKAKAVFGNSVEDTTATDAMEVHDRMDYYISNGNHEDSCEAVAKLVSHILNSGCPTSYKILSKYFDVTSLEYIQDFLVNTPCVEYIPQSVILLNDDGEKAEYLLKDLNKEIRYILTMYYYDNSLTSFKLELYGYRDMASSKVNSGINAEVNEEYAKNLEVQTYEAQIAELVKDNKKVNQELVNEQKSNTELSEKIEKLEKQIKDLQEETNTSNNTQAN